MRRRRNRRGLSLFGALLALGLLGMLVLGATVFFETRALERRGQLAAVQLAVLAEAAPRMLTAASRPCSRRRRAGRRSSPSPASRRRARCRGSSRRPARSGAATGC